MIGLILIRTNTLNMIGIDFEYIKENAPTGDDPGERPDIKNTYCELVQIGACKLDSNGNEVATLNVLVQPHKIITLPKWFVKMTGIDEETRSKGIPFREALNKLVDFIGDESEVWTFNGDWFVLEANLKVHATPNPFAKPFHRLKPLLVEYNIDIENFKRVGLGEVQSGGLYKVLNITLPVIEGVGEHNAEHDARSLIHSIQHLGVK